MTTATAPPAPPTTAKPPPKKPARKPKRWMGFAAVLIAWIGLWAIFRGSNTFPLAQSELTPLHRWFNDVNDSLGASRNTNPIFVYFFNEIRLVIDALVESFQFLVSTPMQGRGLPLIGWLGVVAIGGYVAWVFGNWRVALLTVGGLVFVGLQGLWEETMDTLALTAAAVLIALLIGIPLGIWAGLTPWVRRMVTPVLDFMQIMPPFVYLLPLVLFFGIGPASATIATLIYAMPPTIRITGHAINSVPVNSREAADSMGATGWQRLTKVLLPMAKRTIVLGINQTIMAALAMVTIAALIDAPGLGGPVISALSRQDVGNAFNASLAIVVLAIILDRVTTAASVRAEKQLRHTGRPNPLAKFRTPFVLIGGAITAVLVYLSYTMLWAAQFPREWNIGPDIVRGVDDATLWLLDNVGTVTLWIKDTVSFGLLNPTEDLFTTSPFWLVIAVILAIGALVGGWRGVIVPAICLGLIVATGLWHDAMITLATTLWAIVLTMVFGLLIGVWMGRNRVADQVIRPLLDALQVMPPFVYLVPFLALFGIGRFTAILAAVMYAAPVAIKIVADGIRGVSSTTVEAATSVGSNTRQTITKVQLPMAAKAMTLAANQGMIFVLSMVVIGGLVGAGALGYDVVSGFSQNQLYGKGLAAGIAIVLLGITLDRITQAAANRLGRAPSSG